MCYGGYMKKTVLLLLTLVLCLALAACGKSKAAPEEPGETSEYSAGAEAVVTPVPLPLRSAEEIEITPENWSLYFTVAEGPLYMFNPNGGVRELEQNYCIVLRDEFLHRFRDYGSYRVDFEVSFDVYVNSLDYDKENNLFLHTDDLYFAKQAQHRCSFTASALNLSSYGSNYADYLSGLEPSYLNAFFTGSANYSDGVWAGFYVDLNSVQILDARGTLSLG